MSAKCKSCGAAIVWAKTTGGRTMPVDAEPVEGGTIHLDGSGGCSVLGGDTLDKFEARFPGVKLHKSHFSTCPQASQHRKPKS